ncbi:FAD-dependent oxidoreductase [Pseudonocardia acaciae]|uniref:FAD-dependent oxidoreductase n=1 Tax=Pseudonocardia acaciae TaxID=551276 RepID=UPI0006845D36
MIIIGAGLGGLCLAQGLRRAGVSVGVYERDRSATDRLQGYRIHIDTDGSRALHECLPPALWRALVATAGDPGTGFTFLTERLAELLAVDAALMTGGSADPADGHHAVSRITLRLLLMGGLDDALHFGKEFERYEHAADGRVTAHFADGTSVTGDVLVGADGVNSRVRRQYLPHAGRVATEGVGVGGKLTLDPHTRAWLPSRIAGGLNFVVAPEHALFTAIFARRATSQDAMRELDAEVRAAGLDPDLLLRGAEDVDYVLWAFITHRDTFGADAEALPAEALRERILAVTGGWHPDLRRVISDTDPATVSLFGFRSSVPVPPWPSGPVVLIGDAIHSMPPTGGIGGNTALRDAQHLSRALASVHRGERALPDAVREFEARMRDYAFAAVRHSMRNHDLAVTSGRLRRLGFRAFLRACALLPPMRRRAFGRNWSNPTASRSPEARARI